MGVIGVVRLVVVAAAGLAGSAVAAGVKAPPFHASVTEVTAAQLGASYRTGCPVGPAGLRELQLSYWGFDGRAHRGSLVVGTAVVNDVKGIFARLYAARFPIRRIEPIDRYGGSDDRSMAADNTSAFNCRYAVAAGPKRWSAHSYGEAIDVNPRENPYLLGDRVYPPAGRPFLDRANARRGMAVPAGPLVAEFVAAGWQWGGRWNGSPDYQHFSRGGG